MTAARRESERHFSNFSVYLSQPKRPSAQLQMGDREIMVIPPVPFLPDLDKIMENPSDLAERLQYLLNKRAQHINEDLLQGRYEVSCNRLRLFRCDRYFLPAGMTEIAAYVEHYQRCFVSHAGSCM